MKLFKSFLNVIALMAIISIYNLNSSASSDSAKRRKLSPMQTMWVGAGVGAAEGITGVPFSNMTTAFVGKNPGQKMMAVMQPFIAKPSRLWTGFGVNSICMMPSTAIQMGGTQMALKAITSQDGKEANEATRSQKMGAAAFAGAASGLIATPTELMVVTMLSNNESAKAATYRIVSQRGISNILRSMGTTCNRDAVFGSLLTGAFPIITESVNKRVDNKGAACISAGVLTGVPGAYFTQPLHVIAVRLRQDLHGKKYKNGFHVACQVIKKEGFGPLWSGVVPRTGRFIVALSGMGALQKEVTQYVEARMNRNYQEKSKKPNSRKPNE